MIIFFIANNQCVNFCQLKNWAISISYESFKKILRGPDYGANPRARPCHRRKTDELLIDKLSEVFTEKQKKTKIHNLLYNLAAAVRTNTPENACLTFSYAVTGRLQDMVDANFKFYKRITDDKDFGKFFFDWLFERFSKAIKKDKQ